MERCNGVEGLPEQPVIYHRLDHLAVDRAALPLATPGRPDAARPFVSRYASSARFSSRTGPKPENGPRFFEVFKGICGGDRTIETGKGPKIGL